MKLKNILFPALALVSLSACNDYLDVEAPSAYTVDFVFSQKTEINRALNGVYAQALVNNLYGNAYQSTFILNSDVDMKVSSASAHSHDGYYRLDCDEQGGAIYSFWTAAYNLIEYANKFVRGIEQSPLYKDGDVLVADQEILQMLGEAKCLRAMAYHDLVVMYGDVPFTMTPASDLGTDYVIPIAKREVIQQTLIDDLKQASISMSAGSSVTVERCNKEFAQALIARIALTAGGYSLHPDEQNSQSYGRMTRPDNWRDFYQTAMAYADSVIVTRSHSLSSTYQQVFVDECNYKVVNNDDPIFEIPFAREANGNTGYSQGPTYSAYEGKTVGPWGECSGGTRLNAFYRYLFHDGDMRREFVNGLWYYSYYTTADGSLADSCYIRNDYTVHNNKWSKLWTSESQALGSDKSGSTGINYPYMRYADVLLMYAEAANELSDGAVPQKAIDCLTEVHNRAFPNGDPLFRTEQGDTEKDAFRKSVLNERKWEFAGENMRWRDLVRTNTYAEEVVYSFLRYYSAGMQNVGGMTGYEDAINEHDGRVYIDNLPSRIYYHCYTADEPIKPICLKSKSGQFYGYTVTGTGLNLYFDQKYPNQSLKSLRILNPYAPAAAPATSDIANNGFSALAWNNADFYQWGNENSGTPKDQCKYSFYGYIRGDDGGNIWLIDNGALTQLPTDIPAADKLPVVRYILPYPNLAIQRSAGAYKNYYGY